MCSSWDLEVVAVAFTPCKRLHSTCLLLAMVVTVCHTGLGRAREHLFVGGVVHPELSSLLFKFPQLTASPPNAPPAITSPPRASSCLSSRRSHSKVVGQRTTGRTSWYGAPVWSQLFDLQTARGEHSESTPSCFPQCSGLSVRAPHLSQMFAMSATEIGNLVVRETHELVKGVGVGGSEWEVASKPEVLRTPDTCLPSLSSSPVSRAHPPHSPSIQLALKHSGLSVRSTKLAVH